MNEAEQKSPDGELAKSKCWILVPAAGIGRRMGGTIPKQYLPVAGQTILQWTLARLQQINDIEQITLILHPDDTYWQPDWCLGVHTVTGGDERYLSVMNGLLSLKQQAGFDDWVLVHDVVRPCVTVDDINKLIASLFTDPVGGLLASRVKDSLKYSTSGSVVDSSLERQDYWLAATPQMFRYGLLCEAMEKVIEKDIAITDEASAMEVMGHQVKLVEGRSDNVKVTEVGDLSLIEFLLKQENRIDQEDSLNEI